MMKKALLLSLALGVVFSTQAQLLSQWNLKRVYAAAGQDRDLPQGMDHDYFLTTTEEGSYWDYSNLQVDQRYVSSMVCENPHFRAGVSFQHRSIPQLELAFNVMGIFNRIDAIEYSSPDKNWGDPGFQQLAFDVYTNEIGLESSIAYRLERGAFALIGSAGANTGYVFDGSVSVWGHNMAIEDDEVSLTDDGANGTGAPEYFSEYLLMRDGVSARAFVGLGGSVTLFRRVEIGAELRYGIGGRFINGADPIQTNLQAFNFRAAWVLR